MSGVSLNPTPTLLATKPPVIEARLRPVTSPAEREGDPAAWKWGDEYVDPRVVVDEINWGANGQPSTASLHYELGEYGDDYTQVAAEDAPAPGPGSLVRIVEKIPAEEEGASETEVDWFFGVVGLDETLVQGSPQGERRSFTAYGPELRLSNTQVSGAWYMTRAKDDANLSGTGYYDSDDQPWQTFVTTDRPVIFNEGGRPNADPQPVALYRFDGYETASNRKARTFCAPDRRVIVNGKVLFQAVHWTAYTAVRSLVEQFDRGAVIDGAWYHWHEIERVLGDTPIGEVNVEGRTLPEAMTAVLSPIGFGWCVRPWSHKPESGKHILEVYSKTASISEARTDGPVLAKSGDTIATDPGDRGEVQRLHFIRDSHNVANEITVLGQPRRVQVQLDFNGTTEQDLYPIWETDIHPVPTVGETGDFSLIQTEGYEREWMTARYNPDGKDFHKYRHVWRSFAWNEDGMLSEFANDGGTPILPDLADYGLDDAARIPRPVGATLVYDDESKVKQRPAEVWCIVGDAKVQVPALIWPDRAGFSLTAPFVTVSDEEIDWWCPFRYSPKTEANDALRYVSYLQLLRNTIEQDGQTMTLRVIGTVEDDTYARGRAPYDWQKSSWPFPVKRTIRAGGRFRRYEVTVAPDGEAETVDEVDAAAEYARKVRAAMSDQLGHGSLILRTLSRKFPPGRAIAGTHIGGRIVELDTFSATQTYRCTIVDGVRWRFAPTPSTELLLDTPLLSVT